MNKLIYRGKSQKMKEDKLFSQYITPNITTNLTAASATIAIKEIISDFTVLDK